MKYFCLHIHEKNNNCISFHFSKYLSSPCYFLFLVVNTRKDRIMYGLNVCVLPKFTC